MITKTVTETMSRDFARITPEMPVVEATSLLIKKALLGSPVIDASGMLVGWVSEQECLHVSIQVLYHNQRVTTVRNIMRTDVISVTESTDLLELATQMLLVDRPKTYPVVDVHKRVIGIITRRDILVALDKELGELARYREL